MDMSHGASYEAAPEVAFTQLNPSNVNTEPNSTSNNPPASPPFLSQNADSLPLPELRERARHHVQDAIHTMPQEKKQAYMQALQKAPELVETESDPLRFVRYASYNIWDAANRLVLHWQERLEAFGPKRAFLPLNLSGKGALTKKDVLSLKAGFPALLPRNKLGLQIMYCDRRQWISTADTKTRIRCLFYIQNLLAQEERSQTEGILCFVLLVMPRVKDYDRGFVQKAALIVKNAFPVKFNIHLLNRLPKTTSKRYMIQDLITSYASQLLEIGLGVEVHFEREHGQLVEELQDLGLSTEGIPQACGGSWKFDVFARWCLDKAEEDTIQSVEEQQPPTDDTNTPDSSCSLKPKSQGATKDERTRRRRAVNAMHSRRKRDRRRQEFEDMKKEASVLEAENSLLKAEQRRLEGLLQTTKEEVNRCAEGPTKTTTAASEQTSGQSSEEHRVPLKKRFRR